MNLQPNPISPNLRVLIVNPLAPASQMLILKIMSGIVFGKTQRIDLILLVYANEKEKAEEFKAELFTLGFGHVKTVSISTNLPKISDADVFCFLTNFINPNKFVKSSFEDDDQFDAMYLLLKIANSLAETSEPENEEETKVKPEKLPKKLVTKEQPKPRKPLIVVDGVVTLDILQTMSNDLPADSFFCSTPIEAISDIVLGDFLRVKTHEINHKFIWAANHEVFHVEYLRPLVTVTPESSKKKEGQSCLMVPCGRSDLDYVQFNETWMKKNFVEKVLDLSRKNPYGHIYKAAMFCGTLNAVWKGRTSETPVYTNAGVISDGSLDTFKGFTYVLPIVITGDTWKVNDKFKDDPQLQLEIKRINKVVRQNHSELKPFCKTFLQENVLNLQFMPLYEQSLTSFSFSKMSEENVIY